MATAKLLPMTIHSLQNPEEEEEEEEEEASLLGVSRRLA
jgi:hypothetical protein